MKYECERGLHRQAYQAIWSSRNSSVWLSARGMGLNPGRLSVHRSLQGSSAQGLSIHHTQFVLAALFFLFALLYHNLLFMYKFYTSCVAL